MVARAKYLAVYIRRWIGATERDRHFARDQFHYDQVEMSFAARKAKHCATAEWTTKHEEECRILRWLPGYARMSGFLRFAPGSVAPPKVQKRRALGDANLFHLSNKDGVIARSMGLYPGAIQIG